MKNLYHSAISSWNLAGARVLVRADLNVPLKDGIILNDHRLQALLPTLSLIRKKEGRVVIISHLGRPAGPDPALSTRHLMPWFTKQGYPILFAQNPEDVQKLSTTENPLILMENLRFFAGEQTGDSAFAQKLAQLGDYYVNDAFGSLHRTDTSITLVPRLFSPDHRTIGLLVAHEFAMLSKLTDSPARPFLLIVGGAKVKDKIPLISQLISTVDQIMLCPAIVFSFLQAQGTSVGKSIIDETSFAACQTIMHEAARLHKEIFLPYDYLVADHALGGSLSTVAADTISSTSIGISIGPKTTAAWTPIIAQAKTIFFNGFCGLESRPETLVGAQTLLNAMAHAHAFTVVGGGDTVGLVEQLTLEKRMNFCSTGGGATIAYLSGEPLPGLRASVEP